MEYSKGLRSTLFCPFPTPSDLRGVFIAVKVTSYDRMHQLNHFEYTDNL